MQLAFILCKDFQECVYLWAHSTLQMAHTKYKKKKRAAMGWSSVAELEKKHQLNSRHDKANGVAHGGCLML